MRMARSPAIARTAGSWVGRGGHPQLQPLRAPSVLREGAPRVDHPSSAPSFPARSAIESRRPSCPRAGSARRAPCRRIVRVHRRGLITQRAATRKRGGLPRRRPVVVRRGCRGLERCCWLTGDEHQSRQSATPARPAAGDAGCRARCVAAMEDAPAAIYCLGRRGATPVWANARARALGADRDAAGRRRPAGRRRRRRGPAHRAARRRLRAARAPTARRPRSSSARCAWPAARARCSSSSPTTPRRTPRSGPRPADVVEQAQLSLLPPSLPLLPDLRLVRQLPPRHLGAGGRRRLVRRRAAGRRAALALVVGDAVGHGVPGGRGDEPAARRHALHAPCATRRRRSVLAALDAFAAQMDDVEGASVFYGVLDAGTGRLAYTAAGHPAPLVVHADGRHVVPPGDAAAAAGQPAGRGRRRSPSTCSSRARRWCCSPTAPSPAAPATRRRARPAGRGRARGPGGARRRWTPTASAGLAAAIAEGVRRPQGWPDDVAVLVAHRRATPLEPLRLELAGRARGPARGPPPARQPG